MDKDMAVKCFNEWMRRFIDEPERFRREFQSVAEFELENAAGVEPSYGQRCAAYMEMLAAEMA